MAKKPSLKTRVKNAVDGARAGGMEVGHVVVKPDDEIEIIAGKPGEQMTDNETENWLARHALQRQGH